MGQAHPQSLIFIFYSSTGHHPSHPRLLKWQWTILSHLPNTSPYRLITPVTSVYSPRTVYGDSCTAFRTQTFVTRLCSCKSYNKIHLALRIHSRIARSFSSCSFLPLIVTSFQSPPDMYCRSKPHFLHQTSVAISTTSKAWPCRVKRQGHGCLVLLLLPSGRRPE